MWTLGHATSVTKTDALVPIVDIAMMIVRMVTLEYIRTKIMMGTMTLLNKSVVSTLLKMRFSFLSCSVS